MKIAVLGVGLIGGSIGLAARGRAGAEVAGFDSDPAVLATAVEAGAISERSESIADAVAGADAVFCCAPVGALEEIVRAALAAAPSDAVITDVGSTKAALVAAITDDGAEGHERFIGGHPLAGAEAGGVEHARGDLFDGARWYLTPTERSAGVQYDRLQRLIADLGARPQAIDADSHDRLMATVSHLPHVLANVLVGHASEALAAESEHLPSVGPSFRAATRVAGANPAIWNDIFRANAAAVADGIDDVVERLRRIAGVLRAGDEGALARWHGGAREQRTRILEAELGGGELRVLRVGVENRPGIVAEIALALGRAQVNIEDMELAPAADMASGAIALWVAGPEEAERASRVLTELGHTVTVEAGER